VWAPTTVSKKTNMVPLAIAGGVALAVSAVILSRR
jgi:predicted NodU family carbamoyl transferase